MVADTSSATRPIAARPPLVDRRHLVAFILVTSLFFSWALAASLNDVLIRQFQKALDLSRGQSGLIQFAFYVGYFCAAIPAGLLIRRIGYKKAILVGLGLYAAGAFLFYPAASIQAYGLFLIALYTIAFGLAFLETAANPYVIVLGHPDTGSARLNLAQSFYGVGAILGPVIGGLFIFSGVDHSADTLAGMDATAQAAWRASEAAAVQGPYLIIGIAVVLLALLIARTRFPAMKAPASAETGPAGGKRPAFAALRHAGLRRAVIAQFFYVGAQVGIWSFFIDFTKDVMPGMDERTVAFLLSGSFALLMIGRFSGAIIQRRVPPASLLALYAGANILLCLAATFMTGVPAVGALWLTSFFMSIMFPTIFALGLRDLGPDTEMGSSFLIMSIIGGALVPPLMGLVSDLAGGIHYAMPIPAACFAICLAFALHARRQGGAA